MSLLSFKNNLIRKGKQLISLSDTGSLNNRFSLVDFDLAEVAAFSRGFLATPIPESNRRSLSNAEDDTATSEGSAICAKDTGKTL